MENTEKLYNNDEYQNNMGCLVRLIEHNGGATLNDTFMLLILSQLTRAADALEDIASKLENIGDFADPL